MARRSGGDHVSSKGRLAIYRLSHRVRREIVFRSGVSGGEAPRGSLGTPTASRTISGVSLGRRLSLGSHGAVSVEVSTRDKGLV